MRHLNTIVCVAAALLIALPGNAGLPQVTVKTSKAKNVSRVLYGWHYEEIGNIGDGGKYKLYS